MNNKYKLWQNFEWKFIAFISIILLLQVKISAQENHYKFKNLLDIESQAISFMKDNDGFIWIGTYVDGLYRFDGKNTKHYLKSSNFVSSNNIPDMLQDRDGFLWFISNGAGLTRYDKETNSIKNYFYDPENSEGLNSSSFYWEGRNILIEDKEGFLWVGTIGGGLNKFDKTSEKFDHFKYDATNNKSLSHNNVRSVYEDRKGNIWVGTEKGLNFLQNGEKEFIHFFHDPNDATSISGNIIMSIFEDSKGRIWFGTENNGINLIHDDYKTFTRYNYDPANDNSPASNYVNHIAEDSDGNIWFSHQSRLTILDSGSNTFLQYQGDCKDISQVINDEEDGVIWTLSDRGILCLHNPNAKAFKLYRPEANNTNSISSEVVISIYEDSNEELWISTLHGLNRYNPKNGKFTLYLHKDGNQKTLPTNSNYSPGIFEDSDGNFWIGNAVPSALSLFDREKGEVIKSYLYDPSDPESIPDAQQLNSIIEDKYDSDILWIGSFKGLIRFNKNTEKFITFGTQTHWNIWEDDNNNIWATTWGEGLSKFNKLSNEFIYFKNIPDDKTTISDNLAVTLFIDSKDQMWIGSEAGLNLFDFKTNTFIRFSEEEGYPIRAIHSIGEDKLGNLWLGTTAGLIKFDPNSKEYHVFTPEDGIQGWVFYANNGITSASGEMWFGGTKGMNSFYPEEIKINKKTIIKSFFIIPSFIEFLF